MTLHTPDQRYIIVRGRLWRAANPDLFEDERASLVAELMDAACRRRSRTALSASASILTGSSSPQKARSYASMHGVLTAPTNYRRERSTTGGIIWRSSSANLARSGMALRLLNCHQDSSNCRNRCCDVLVETVRWSISLHWSCTMTNKLF